jgi:hypothetical protein
VAASLPEGLEECFTMNRLEVRLSIACYRLEQLGKETVSRVVLDGIGKQSIGFARKTRRDADT